MRSLFFKIFLWFWVAMVVTVLVFATVVANTQPQPGSESSMSGWPHAGNADHPGGPGDTPSSRLLLMVALEVASELIASRGPQGASSYLAKLETTRHVHVALFDARYAEVKWRAANGLLDSNSPRSSKPVALKLPAMGLQVQRKLNALVQRASDSDHALTQFLETDDSKALLGAQQIQVPRGKRYVIALVWPVDQPEDNGRPDAPAGTRIRDGVRDHDAFQPGDGRRGSPDGHHGPPDEPPGPPPWRIGLSRLAGLLLFADATTQVIRLFAIIITTGLVCYLLVRYLTAPIVQLRAATHLLATGELSTRVESDLSRRRDEMGVLGRDFDRMAEHIESLVKAQNRLIADVSHELRSPLARLSMALGLVRTTAGPAATEDLDRIERETERLNALIEQLLTLSRLESGGQKPAPILVDMARLVASVCEDVNFEARSRGCEIKLTLSASGMVMGTESLLYSAVENVVRNAVRYTNLGTSVDVSLDCQAAKMLHAAASEKIQAGRDSAEHYVVIQVRDYGSGVPDEALPHLMRPFYRVENARDRQRGGAGLGLAIAEGAVRMHGGTIEAANAPNGGLIVEIYLPVTELEPVA